jgi:hypothetical protein
MRKLLVAVPLAFLFFVVPPASFANNGGAAHAAGRSAMVPAPVACPSCYHPRLLTSWQWQLSGKVDTGVRAHLYDIDGFDSKKGLVSALHAMHRRVVCYISAGSWENWRPDASQFPSAVKGKPNGWPGERWLDIRDLADLEPIMYARLRMCAAKGFDAVELDNVDGYENNTGFPLTGADQALYNATLANYAHSRGLSVVLKNDLDQVVRLLPYFDFALNEQCFQYSECRKLKPFVQAGKAVFGVEYALKPVQFCPRANALNFDFLRKHLALGPWRRACR